MKRGIENLRKKDESPLVVVLSGVIVPSTLIVSLGGIIILIESHSHNCSSLITEN